MYSQCAVDSAERIDVVKRVVAANEMLRELLYSEAHLSDHPTIRALREAFPTQAKWKVFEHCAAVTRLYAILEQCISELVHTWLDDLPRVVPNYASLGTIFEAAHREGVAWVLKNAEHARYKHLSRELVCRDFADAVAGLPQFRILPESFLYENRTLKMERITDLLARLCMHNGWTWFINHRAIKEYLQETRGGESTCESELRTFISYRNDAAHGNISEVLGLEPLKECADFILAMCVALCAQFGWNRVNMLRLHRSLRPLGKVTEVFPRVKAVVAIISQATIAIGQTVAIVGPQLYRELPIKSIQDNGEPIEMASIAGEKELGLQFDWMPSKNCELFSLELPQAGEFQI